MTRRHVLVAGCGDVGTVVGQRLAAGGHRVWGLRRNAKAVPAPIEPIGADLGRPETLRDLPPEIDTVVYAAAADELGEAAYRRAYVDGPRHLLAALGDRGAQLERVVLASSTAVYGQMGGEWVDEESATDPPGFSGRLVLEGETVVRRVGAPGVVVRLSGIYGPGRTGLLDAVRAGRAAVPPPGTARWTNRVHRDDAAGALVHLALLPNAGGVWIASDDEPVDVGEIVRWLAAQLGAPPPPVAAGPEPAGAGSARARTNKRCRNGKLVASGYRLAYPTFREGYASVIQSLPGHPA